MIENIDKYLDKLPTIIEAVRTFLIDKLGITEPTYQILIAVFALVGSYYFLKQWITNGVFFRLSTILNWLLIGLLLYTIFVYV